jgi:two-component system, LytTR family, sensor kinase
MLEQQQLAALLIKIAVAASIASILMRFARIQKMLLRDERTVSERLQLAGIFSLIFGASAGVRILSQYQYGAIDLALEGAQIAGMLGGYVTGLITGLCVSLPDMFEGKFMSMPLFAAAGLLGALMHDLAPSQEDVWHFSPFFDLNLYRLLRQILRLNRSAIQRQVVERAAFNVACSAIVVVTESLRWGVYRSFSVHGTFFLFQRLPDVDGWTYVASAITTLFAVSLPIRIWNSFRTERKLEMQHVRLTEARLAALTNQINPHFLFNTLNSISTLIRLDPDRARTMIQRLSKILRRLLRKTENMSPLREEISFIDDYLGIEIVRFGDKLKFEKQIDGSTLDRLVPSMILQPIIENSIRHGLSNKVEGGTVRLSTWLEGARLVISIEDDGIGMEESRIATVLNQEGGIGVANVNERLRVLFGGNYRMEVDSRRGFGTRTVIEIPDLAG